jgi:hypothetical protein
MELVWLCVVPFWMISTRYCRVENRERNCRIRVGAGKRLMRQKSIGFSESSAWTATDIVRFASISLLLFLGIMRLSFWPVLYLLPCSFAPISWDYCRNSLP